MKRFVCVVLMFVVAACFTGCPLAGGSKKLIGEWQWMEPSRLVNPTTVDDYDSPAVAQNFANEGRLQKALVFTEENGFTYVEKAFLPDRQAALRADKGAGVSWSWVQTYITKGTYETERYADVSRETATPGLDTEINVAVSEYTDTFAVTRRDTNGNLVPDNQLRIMVDYITSTSTVGADNPLVLRGLLGLNPFDELMVSWAQFSVGKDLAYNRSHESNVETYLRVSSE